VRSVVDGGVAQAPGCARAPAPARQQLEVKGAAVGELGAALLVGDLVAEQRAWDALECVLPRVQLPHQHAKLRGFRLFGVV